MPTEWLQPLRGLQAGFGSRAIHPDVCGQKRAKQPRPHSALMVGRVAGVLVTIVMADITRIPWTERAQTKRRQEFASHYSNHAGGAFRRKHAVLQADCQDLVWPDRCNGR